MHPASILFFSDKIRFTLRNKTQLRTWLLQVMQREGVLPGDLTYVFTSDKNLLAINREFLQHDFFTDVITFDYSSREKKQKRVSGEIYLSIDRIKENSRQLKVSFQSELRRVMVHGLLHLCGHGDKSEKQQLAMRRLEDFYLSLLT